MFEQNEEVVQNYFIYLLLSVRRFLHTLCCEVCAMMFEKWIILILEKKL